MNFAINVQVYKYVMSLTSLPKIPAENLKQCVGRDTLF